MNLTQFERVKSELKRIFYELNKTSGKTINYEKRILLKLTEQYVFEVGRRIPAKA